MIQINKNNNKLFTDLAIRYSKEYLNHFETNVDTEINSVIRKNKNPNLDAFYRTFQNDWRNIITASTTDIIYFKSKKYRKFNSLFFIFKNNKWVKTPACEKLITILGYENVRDSQFMYEIVKDMGIKACPYCNAHPIHAYKVNKKSRLHTQLDHYYPKSIYPYLSVAFYNLIPICSYCNNRKGNEEFPVGFYHPYSNNVASKFEFKIENDVKKLIAGKDIRKDIKIGIKDITKYTDRKKNTKSFSFSEKMELKELYENYTEVAAEIFMKSKMYNITRKKELTKLLSSSLNKKVTETEMTSLILGSYIGEDEILKRPITKFMQDIAKDVGLL